MKTFKEIDLIQGSQEWLDYRKTKVTATDASKIMGLNPYSSITACYEEKVEDKKTFVNAAMKRGSELEEEARTLLSIRHGVTYTPKVLESLENPFLAASLDGITADGSKGAEIKCPGENNMAKALRGEFSKTYEVQCQHQMYVTGLQEITLFFYFNEYINKEIIIKRDEKMIAKIIKASSVFYNNHLIPRVKPLYKADMSLIDDETANQLAERWKELDEREKETKKDKKEIENMLGLYADDKNCVFTSAGLKHTVIERKGTVDWSKICEVWKINTDEQENYRKENTRYAKFTSI